MEILPAGEQAVVLSMTCAKTRDCVSETGRVFRYLKARRHPSILSMHPGFDSILIEFSPGREFDEWLEEIRLLDLSTLQRPVENPSILTVPICYDLGLDMASISEKTNLKNADIVELHSSQDYEVWMMGFMPGFPYMGELQAPLQIARKKNPDPLIPSGSVAIAEEYVGIYPFDSPGGWHVIGRTPLRIIDYSRQIPWIFDYGMKIRFQPISMIEFERMKKA